MTLVDALVIILIFGSFAILIWSRLVKRNHPIVPKIQGWLSNPKEKIESLSESEKWQQPNIERKIY
ncbi:hypothetical protein LCGC14_0538270 [marine sediment metagenome]|uniref:Uncharacterized protein n=1 Tax=marine sediment metagenome TaxID=412755 RepID=A0A0F9RYC8_9ZZZZ|nr:hypothetical protein [bacterium]